MLTPPDNGKGGPSSDDTQSTADGDARPGGVKILPAGTQVGRYVLLSDIGVGGMGVIYKAYDPQLERAVALKLLHAAGDSEAALRFRERLLREAQALAQLAHPNVVAVHDVGTFGEGVFIAMEFIEGQTLNRWVKLQPRRLLEVVKAYLAAGEGLAAAHRAGLVHRDFKPENVLVGNDGRVRVLDFGLARMTADERADVLAASAGTTGDERPPPPGEPAPPTLDSSPSLAPDDRRTTRLGSHLTRSGTILGTPRFMAPEQHLGEAVDARADQFSFCVSLWEAVYEQFPFGGVSLGELKDAVINGRIRDTPPAARVPRWLHRTLVRGLAARPGDRHPTMDALLLDLSRHLERGRTRSLALALSVGAALALALTVWGVLAWRARSFERVELCRGGPRRFAGVWDATQKARVRAALLGIGKPYAADVWRSVETALDGYAARWADMHRDSCEATRLRGEQTDQVMTLRMVCLDRKLQEMGALVDVLAHADEAMVVKAAPAAAGLSAIDACADVPGLLAEVPLPRDPTLRDRINAIRADVARADALRLAGRSAAAIEVAAQAVRAARATENHAVIAEALLCEGRAQVQVDPARAPDSLSEAFWGAYATRQDRVALSAAVLASRAYAMVLRFDDSVAWEQRSRAGLERLGGDDVEEAELYTSLFFRAYEQHRAEAQIETAAKAARLSERHFGLDDLRTFVKEQNELTALTNGDHVLEAWRLRGPLLARQEKLLGAQHPMLGRSLMDLGDDEVRLGRFGDARAHLGRAEQLFRNAGETETLSWTALRTYQLRLALAEGRIADAEALVRETMALLARLQILDSERALDIRMGQARVEAQLGHVTEALAIARRLLLDAERTHGKDNMELGEILDVLVDISLHAGRLDDARELAERDVAIVRAHADAKSDALAEARVRLARVLVAQRRAADALALIESSEPILLGAIGQDAPLAILARRTRGEALAALDRAPEALVALDAALATARRVGIDPVEQRAMQALIDQLRRRPMVKLGTTSALPAKR